MHDIVDYLENYLTSILPLIYTIAVCYIVSNLGIKYVVIMCGYYTIIMILFSVCQDIMWIVLNKLQKLKKFTLDNADWFLTIMLLLTVIVSFIGGVLLILLLSYYDFKSTESIQFPLPSNDFIDIAKTMFLKVYKHFNEKYYEVYFTEYKSFINLLQSNGPRRNCFSSARLFFSAFLICQ